MGYHDWVFAIVGYYLRLQNTACHRDKTASLCLPPFDINVGFEFRTRDKAIIEIECALPVELRSQVVTSKSYVRDSDFL